MNNEEKTILLKNSIYQFYVKEGRSKSYISRVLELDRKVLTNKINEWGFVQANIQHLSPSNEKFLNKNKEFIKKQLDLNLSLSEISRELKIDRKLLKKMILSDSVLTKSLSDFENRKELLHQQNIDSLKDKSSYIYDFEDIEGEIWKDILGYEKYQVSNMGRIKAYSKRYDSYHLLTPYKNKENERLYVSITNGVKRKNLQVSRLVAFTFLGEPPSSDLTVNHKDGNVENNKLSNLEWMTQADNNEHSYKKLDRPVVNSKRFIFDKIVYKDKYEFKTVKSFAKFIDKSETQARRYLENPEKYEIKIIKNNEKEDD